MDTKNILRYPRLDTKLMVEEFIRKNSGEYSRKQIWDRLPKKMMYQTFCTVLDYLFESGKVVADKGGKVVWIWNPELVRKYMKRKDLFWRADK